MAYAEFGADSLARKKRVYYEGSDTIYEGMALCYNQDTTDSTRTSGTTVDEGDQCDGKWMRVEKPKTANLKYFAGVVASGSHCGLAGPRWVDIYVPNGAIVPVRGTDNHSIGEALFIANADYELTNVPQVGGFVGYAMETVDRSSTEGLLLAKLLPTGLDRNDKAAVAKTANYTVDETDTGTIFTNTGASGAVTFTLPSAPSEGLEYQFIATAQQNIVIDPGDNDKFLFGDGSTAAGDGKKITITPADANSLGVGLKIRSISTGDWLVIGMVGAPATFVVES